MWSVSTLILISFRGTGVGTFSSTQLTSRLSCWFSFVNFPAEHNSAVLCDWSSVGSFFIDPTLSIPACDKDDHWPLSHWSQGQKKLRRKYKYIFFSVLPCLWSWWRFNPSSQHCYRWQRPLSFCCYNNCSFAHETLCTWCVTYTLWRGHSFTLWA